MVYYWQFNAAGYRNSTNVCANVLLFRKTLKFLDFRSISTRTASGVWWFFCLIMVSSYTANLAAFLTVETLVTPFTNVKELTQLTDIKYGAKRDGATATFFKVNAF